LPLVGLIVLAASVVPVAVIEVVVAVLETATTLEAVGSSGLGGRSEMRFSRPLVDSLLLPLACRLACLLAVRLLVAVVLALVVVVAVQQRRRRVPLLAVAILRIRK
jgi:hypothetical protein